MDYINDLISIYKSRKEVHKKYEDKEKVIDHIIYSPKTNILAINYKNSGESFLLSKEQVDIIKKLILEVRD